MVQKSDKILWYKILQYAMVQNRTIVHCKTFTIFYGAKSNRYASLGKIMKIIIPIYIYYTLFSLHLAKVENFILGKSYFPPLFNTE